MKSHFTYLETFKNLKNLRFERERYARLLDQERGNDSPSPLILFAYIYIYYIYAAIFEVYVYIFTIKPYDKTT